MRNCYSNASSRPRMCACRVLLPLLLLFAASLHAAAHVSGLMTCAPQRGARRSLRKVLIVIWPQLRVKTRLAAKTFDRAESLQTDFTRETFGAVAVARVIVGEHEEASLIGAGECGEGFRIARLRAPDQFAFVLLSRFLLRPSHEMYQSYRHGARDLVGLPMWKLALIAERTLEGFEAMNMIRKGQIKRLIGSDAMGQAKFILNVFRVAA